MRSQLRTLVKEAKSHYPESKNMRKQWVKKTKELMDTGRHVLYGGKTNWKAYNAG